MQRDDPQVLTEARLATESTNKRFGFTKHRFRTLAWSYAFLLTLLSRIWTVKDPGPADSELFSYIGREWIRGIIPYKQIWEDKPPGIFAVNALAAVFHKQFIALAAFEFVALFATILLIHRILSELQCGSLAKWTAPFVAASILSIPYYTPGGNQTEIYILPFAACCIYSFLRATRNAALSPSWLILTGLSAGIAGIFKPVGIASLLAITLVLCVDLSRRLISRLAAVALTWTACLAVWGIAVAYFAPYGAVREMANATLFYNLQYAAAIHHPILESIFLMVDRLSVVGSILGCAIAWFLFWLWPNISRAIPPFFNTRQQSAALLLFLWLAADLCGARAADKYYAHYFLPSLLSLIVISCITIDVLAKLISSIKHSQILIYILLIPIGIAGLKGQIDYFHSASDNPPDEWKRAGLFIRDHKGPSDVTFTWGFRPGVYRIADSHTLTHWADAHYIDDFPGAYKSIGRELISELKTSPPNFIVYDCNMSPLNQRDTVRIQFLQLLESNYRLVYRTGGTCVSER
jgi:hypothetical protein